MKHSVVLLITCILFLFGCGENEQELYQRAIDSGMLRDYAGYLDKYPDGIYATEIKGKLEELHKRMKYVVNDSNWEFLSGDYNRQYGELHQIFKSQCQNIQMTGSAKDVKWAWSEMMKFWEMPPIRIDHFDQINALGCWTREVDAEGGGSGLGELLPMYAKGILRKKILESATEEARLLKLTLLDWIVDMSRYADFNGFLRYMQENEKDAGVLGSVDEVLVKVKTVY